MAEYKKSIAILGSTGSIGTQALEVVDKLSDFFIVTAISAGNNVELLTKQIQKYKPKYACIKNESDTKMLKGVNCKLFCGEEGLKQIVSLPEVDLVLVALSGKSGLLPTIEAIRNKKEVALANKETLVMAGDIIMQLAKEYGVNIIPVDSEHSAIFQCLEQKKRQNTTDIKNLIITASGGPFRNSSTEQIQNAAIEEVLNHPRWSMGKKITVDSATLMNKGLEVIEAHHLFNMPYENIKVVIHPQSYIHSAVEYVDGSIIAQIGLASMHIPIQYALTYPKRLEGIKTESFDFLQAARFDFFAPDYEKFPLLDLAINAGKIGGSANVCVNAANEEAVFAFLNQKIKFTDIYKLTKSVFDSYTPIKNPTITQILEEDKKIRILTQSIIKSYCNC